MVFVETAFKEQPSGTKKNSVETDMPIKFHPDMSIEQMDTELVTLSNETPMLHIFLDKNGKFNHSKIAGDTKIIDCAVNEMERAVLMLISVYFVFNIGFAPKISQFLGFFQQTCLMQPYDLNKGARFKNFVTRYDTELKSWQETMQTGKKYAS